jgi:SPW repeat-containing protein
MKDSHRRRPFRAADLSQIRCASGTNILLGLWLFFAPLFLGYTQLSIRWNDTVAGLVLFGLATLRCLRPVAISGYPD